MKTGTQSIFKAYLCICMECFNVYNSTGGIFCGRNVFHINAFRTGNSLMGTFANSEDRMKCHNAGFNQGLHYLLRQNRSSKKRILYLTAIKNAYFIFGLFFA